MAVFAAGLDGAQEGVLKLAEVGLAVEEEAGHDRVEEDTPRLAADALGVGGAATGGLDAVGRARREVEACLGGGGQGEEGGCADEGEPEVLDEDHFLSCLDSFDVVGRGRCPVSGEVGGG